jgi:hypothetical protein
MPMATRKIPPVSPPTTAPTTVPTNPPAPKTVARKKAVKATKPTKPVKPVKAPKPVAAPTAVKAPVVKSPVAAPKAKPKAKLVRDSFTIPKSEYLLLDDIKQRAVRLARPTKKGEILRAGIAVLHAMGDEALLAALNAVPSLKTGRPNRVDPAAAQDEIGKA